MNKPRYAFEAYLTQLLSQKEERQRDLAAALGREAEEIARLDELLERRKQLEGDSARWKEELGHGLRAGEWTVQEMALRQDHLRRLRSDLDDQQRAILAQQRAVERARKAVQEARHALQAVANEVKVHEERKARWLEEIAREELRKEQKRMEEISQALHERRRREEERP
jgi:flagellar export protein FliJ